MKTWEKVIVIAVIIIFVVTYSQRRRFSDRIQEENTRASIAKQELKKFQRNFVVYDTSKKSVIKKIVDSINE